MQAVWTNIYMEENNKLFIDSNFFIALHNPQDTLYIRAKKIANKIERNKIKLFASNFIFLETVTVLSQRSVKETAITAGKKLLMEDYCTMVNVDKDLQHKSWLIFQEIKRKNISFVDCSILTVMRYMGIKKLLTFDTADFAGLRRKYSFNFYAK